MKTNICKFCNIINGIYLLDEVDKPFAESDSFIAIASIGAMIEGWTLIVPKAHSISLKNSYGKKEFEDFVSSVLKRVTTIYGEVIVFEHGANIENSITSCGTDHAHLHIVPFNESLLPAMMQDLSWKKIKTIDISEFVGNNEYLFYSEPSLCSLDFSTGYLNLLDEPISQYFRKLIARSIGITSQFDYKSYPFKEKSLKTQRNLQYL